ncbi:MULTISPECIES: hypothetical protein [unclassified Rhizobium]|uniref:hypothetical protein n=1 Tax=unclassified Rhizobium TaxID=2613769 RepID=UPI000B269AA6|nr:MULTISPECIES: hypothetical protein [unclassified Rhizobium]
MANRTTLTPQIELGSYQCAAGIDCVDVEIELTHRAQYWHLNDLVENVTARKEFPEALDLGEGKTATRYKLRVQEPDLEMVRKVIEAIGNKYGLTTAPSVAGIEISIDFYANKPSEAARARLHGVLIRHFFPTTRVLKANLMWPRFMPGGIKKTDYTVGRNESDDSMDIGNRMAPGTDRVPLYGSTYYLGECDDSRAFWRIQNKVFDKQNKAAGTRDKLADEKKRVRIEVTLGREGCREIGLEQFTDLEALGTARLQKGFFQFMKPTFAIVRPSAARPVSTAVKRKAEEYRRERFLNAGVVGLQIREDAREELRALEMPTIRKLHRR